MNFYEMYEQQIKPAVFERLDSVFPEFGWKQIKNGWQATDSITTKRVFGVRADRVICTTGKANQTPGGFRVHGTDAHQLFTEYANNGLKPSGEEFREIVVELAKRVGLNVEISQAFEELGRQRRERQETEKKRAEAAHKNIDQAVMEYWRSRSLGMDPPEDIGSVDGKLYGLIRDHRGQVAGSFVRALDGSHPKYKYSEGLDWEELIATNMAAAIKNKEATFVEGILEPYFLSHQGVEVQACGGTLSKLTAEKWQRIIKRGIKRVWLAADADAEGQKGLRQALENYRSLDQADLVDVCVIDKNDLFGCKDLGEVLLEAGATGIHTARANAEHHFTWLAKELVVRHRGGGWTSSAVVRCVHESMDILASVKPKQIPFIRDFHTVLAKEIPGYEESRAQIERQLEKQREEKAHALNVRAGLERVRDMLDGTIDFSPEGLAGLAEQFEDLSRVGTKRTDTKDILKRHLERVQKYRGREDRIIGLAQQTIPTLDKSTCGLRGLVLLAAPPNVGKTSLTWQWGLDILASNPRAGFVCITLEMDSEDMMARGICNLAGMQWTDYSFGPHSPRETARIEGAVRRMEEVSPRLWMMDESDIFNKRARVLRREILQWKEEQGLEQVYILFDYLQKFRPPDAVRRGMTAEQIEEWRIDEMWKLRLSPEEPLVVISQIRKAGSDKTSSWQNGLDVVKGTGSNTYSPEMVLICRKADDEELKEWLRGKGQEIDGGLKGDAAKKAMKKWQDELRKSGRSFLILTIDKGRDGVEQTSIPLTFYYRENKFKEEWEWDELWKNRESRQNNDAAGIEDSREISGRLSFVGEVHSMGDGGGVED